MKRQELVRFVPGMNGTPGWMPRPQAEELAAREAASAARLRACGALDPQYVPGYVQTQQTRTAARGR
jgi:hypothetical protein